MPPAEPIVAGYPKLHVARWHTLLIKLNGLRSAIHNFLEEDMSATAKCPWATPYHEDFRAAAHAILDPAREGLIEMVCSVNDIAHRQYPEPGIDWPMVYMGEPEEQSA